MEATVCLYSALEKPLAFCLSQATPAIPGVNPPLIICVRLFSLRKLTTLGPSFVTFRPLLHLPKQRHLLTLPFSVFAGCGFPIFEFSVSSLAPALLGL